MISGIQKYVRIGFFFSSFSTTEDVIEESCLSTDSEDDSIFPVVSYL